MIFPESFFHHHHLCADDRFPTAFGLSIDEYLSINSKNYGLAYRSEMSDLPELDAPTLAICCIRALLFALMLPSGWILCWPSRALSLLLYTEDPHTEGKICHGHHNVDT